MTENDIKGMGMALGVAVEDKSVELAVRIAVDLVINALVDVNRIAGALESLAMTEHIRLEREIGQ